MENFRIVALLAECWDEYCLALEEDPADCDKAAALAAQRTPIVAGGVATIPVRGLIMHRSSMYGTSVEEISRNLRSALADPAVGSVVLDIDSPGGGVSGVSELAGQIRSARLVKPVVAVANPTAASAAYWIASAASEVVVTPSGQAGSIGVYMVHEDVSRALDMEGVTTTVISAGKYKTEASPWAPLTDEAKASLQERVDEIYGQFVADVSAGRGVPPESVRSGFGEGRVRSANRSLLEGLADRVATFDETVTRLAGGAGASLITRAEGAGAPEVVTASTGLEVDVERLQLDLLEL